MTAHTENVILVEEHGKVIGFIRSAIVYKSERMDSDEVTALIDPEYGVLVRGGDNALSKGSNVVE